MVELARESAPENHLARHKRAFVMDPHTLALIAQEWATFKRRLDSAYPETRGTEGYLGGLVESQRCVLDAVIDGAANRQPSPGAELPTLVATKTNC